MELCRLFCPLFLALSALVLPLAGGSLARDRHPDNKLEEFAGGGDWEVWCIRLGASGRVECDLSHVLTYQPRPNFRAMILRVFSEPGGKPRIELETERQTTLGRGSIVAGGETTSLANCGSPCTFRGAEAEALTARLATGGEGRVRFHDFLIEAWDVALPLEGFAAGLAELHRLQQKYGY